MATISVNQLCKTYTGGQQYALNHADFDVKDGEFVFLLGPSGCGKTTLLRMVAGLIMPSSGTIRIDGRNVTYLRPRDRNIGMVFERYALYTHLSVYENLAYPLRVRGLSKDDIDKKIRSIAHTIRIDDVLDRMPGQLSGGQAQRVAIGRMLVREANVFLMDEPISHLDAKLRAIMRVELKHIQRTLKTTTLYVSHDQLEAMTMADRIIVMKDGVIQQIDTPQRIFDAPANTFVATFVGEPHMNLLPCRVATDRDRIFLRGPGFSTEVDADWIARSQLNGHSGDNLLLGVRPEDIAIGVANGNSSFAAKVVAFEPMGAEDIYDVDIGGKVVRVRAPTPEEAGEVEHSGDVLLRFDPKRIHVFEAESGNVLATAAFAVNGKALS